MAGRKFGGFGGFWQKSTKLNSAIFKILGQPPNQIPPNLTDTDYPPKLTDIDYPPNLPIFRNL